MEFMTGKRTTEHLSAADLKGGAHLNQTVTVHGAVHALRDMGAITFMTLRMRDGAVQCVLPQDSLPEGLCQECTVVVTGVLSPDERAPMGAEIRVESLEILSRPAEAIGVPIEKYKLNLNLDTELPLRPVVLRNLRKRAVFKIQEAIGRAFHDTMLSGGFTEIHTPKIVHAGAEGGSNIFRMEYFGKKAFLTQSPQFYKQTMVGVFERVFEIAPVFRAEKHATTRHLNEYISMDMEMGYIDSFEDLMAEETRFLQNMVALLQEEYADDLKRLNVTLPKVDEIPTVRFDEAKRLVSEEYGRPIRDPYDLEPEEEHNIGRYFKEKYGADFVFVTHYPSKKRPFYAMDDPENPKYTLSFDLLFRGLEVTTGGQRIHDYDQQVQKMLDRGMHPEEFESYLMIHKHGMPPHGGLGIGLERLTAQLCGLDNVRYASLFPRDLHRFEP
jgi:nondiscriminating aspartyl-tRNA synthetase